MAFLWMKTYIFTLQFLFLLSATVDPSCDYYQDFVMGQEYYIYSEGYPTSSSKSCRWTGNSPPGTVIVLSCNDVSLPNSRDCQGDRLSLSPSGDASFQDSLNYCGRTTFTAYTNTNKLAVGFFPSSGSVGGRFVCSLAAMKPATDCNCGLHFSKKIVGGQDTGVNEYPLMSALVDVSHSEEYCGASIISKRYAVTAGHCLTNQQPTNLGLLVGDHDLETGADTAASFLYKIESFKQHPLYTREGEHNDIGVVKTQGEIKFSMAVNPACLPFKYQEYNFQGEEVTILGWGLKEFSGNKATILQKANVYVVSNGECELNEKALITQICTYAPGRDACLSDSGGPVLWKDYNTRLMLVGIISQGIGCASLSPGVNTRVTSYLSWIASAASDDEFCIL